MLELILVDLPVSQNLKSSVQIKKVMLLIDINIYKFESNYIIFLKSKVGVYALRNDGFYDAILYSYKFLNVRIIGMTPYLTRVDKY